MIDLSSPKPVYDKSTPCVAKIKEKMLLTSPDAVKKTFHISLDIENTGLHFTPGDSVAVFAQNDPALADRFLNILKCDPDQLLIDPRSQREIDARSYFTSKINLGKVNSSLLKHLITLPGEHATFFNTLLEPENKTLLSEFLANHDLYDALSYVKVPLNIDSLTNHFSPLLPRFYSISSSLKTTPDEVHLLVALASYNYKEEIRYGVASHFLCNLATPGHTEVPVYIQPSKHFKLPENPDTDIIMIGPGTGVAPFRAFLQERLAEGALGKNWLFFGGRNRHIDFLYGDFWQTLQKENKIRLSTAFSRDQEEKHYVQHLLLSHAKEVFEAIENGAYFYVCGDASNMAKDVEAALISVIGREGCFSEEEAKAYFKALKASKRYLTDVY